VGLRSPGRRGGTAPKGVRAGPALEARLPDYGLAGRHEQARGSCGLSPGRAARHPRYPHRLVVPAASTTCTARSPTKDSGVRAPSPSRGSPLDESKNGRNIYVDTLNSATEPMETRQRASQPTQRRILLKGSTRPPGGPRTGQRTAADGARPGVRPDVRWEHPAPARTTPSSTCREQALTRSCWQRQQRQDQRLR